jgi:hypothetical protein
MNYIELQKLPKIIDLLNKIHIQVGCVDYLTHNSTKQEVTNSIENNNLILIPNTQRNKLCFLILGYSILLKYDNYILCKLLEE